MKNKKIKKHENSAEMGEDATKYGEFVCSYFAWISPEQQKQKVDRMEEITKSK